MSTALAKLKLISGQQVLRKEASFPAEGSNLLREEIWCRVVKKGKNEGHSFTEFVYTYGTQPQTIACKTCTSFEFCYSPGPEQCNAHGERRPAMKDLGIMRDHELLRDFGSGGLGSTWTPKVCKIMASYGCSYGFRAMILHTSGVWVRGSCSSEL